ncbi:hypothetical protein [Amycolatopsis taiwanensis]|uniref:hypothetical protein n=1 Tax=Amycolatopsis taiwanensis TaxID=342230 RepID=UPI0004B17EAC|nr:hypothetical protein [Amycolatopsis taiwanensis]
MTTNPALQPLELLVGDWEMDLFNAEFLPDPETRVRGSATFAWVEQGAALVMRQGDNATWIIGRDDSADDFHVLYSDNRGVSRVYRMTFDGHRWTLQRNTAEFSQRFEATIGTEGTTIEGRWEKSFDAGENWQHDFNINYTKTTP